MNQVTTIKIARVINKEQAQKFVDAIDGKTYMNFQVIVAPDYGQLQVSVSTDYDDSREEIQGMLNSVMFHAIAQ